MKRQVEKYDFKAFGQAIKAARKAKGISRNHLADQMHIAPRYIASIENSGQRRQLESLLDDISDKGLRVVTATAKEIKEVETEDE